MYFYVIALQIRHVSIALNIYLWSNFPTLIRGKSEEQTNVAFDHSSVEKDTDQHMCISSNNDKLVENQIQKQGEKDEDGDDGSDSNSEKTVVNSANHGHQDLVTGEEEYADDNSKGGISSQEDCCPAKEEESYDSLFSLSIDSRKQVSAVWEMGDKEVTGPLKPIRNSSIESKKIVNLASFKYDDDDEEDKENVKVDGNRKPMPLSKEPILKQPLAKRDNNEIAVVDTSLSSWLVEHENSAQKTGVSVGNSPESEKNYGDGKILKHFCEPSSGGSTPSCGADNQPCRYWRQMGVDRDNGHGRRNDQTPQVL